MTNSPTSLHPIRADGWTSARQLAFLDALAATRRHYDAVFAVLAIPLGENRSFISVGSGSGAPMSV